MLALNFVFSVLLDVPVSAQHPEVYLVLCAEFASHESLYPVCNVSGRATYDPSLILASAYSELMRTFLPDDQFKDYNQLNTKALGGI